MDSCARALLLLGADLLTLLNWLQAARVSNSAIATKRISVDRRGACSASMCIGCSWCLRFLALGIINFMSYSTDMVIDDFAQPIRDAERLVLRQRMPGSEGKILAKGVLFRGIESLLRDANRR